MTHKRKWLASELATVTEASCWQKLLPTMSVPASYSWASSTLSFLREEADETMGEVCWASIGFRKAALEDETPEEALRVDARLLVPSPSVALPKSAVNETAPSAEVMAAAVGTTVTSTASKVLRGRLGTPAVASGSVVWRRLGESGAGSSTWLVWVEGRLDADESSGDGSLPFCSRWEISRTQ